MHKMESIVERYDTLVFIGRMQPPHAGHICTIRKAMRIVGPKGRVIVALGSCGGPRTPRDPFTSAERREMIMSELARGESEDERYAASSEPRAADVVSVAELVDSPYDNDEWVENVQRVVKRFGVGKVGLIGHAKDGSSYYLKMFPQWGAVAAVGVGDPIFNASDARGLMFAGRLSEAAFVPPAVAAVAEKLMETEAFQALKNEHDEVERYKASWSASPFPPTFVTADCVVVQGGHVLLVKRGRSPGKGLGALPGGFIGAHETLQDAAVRELIEETNIDVPPGALHGSIVASRTFDYPYRSLRGRTVTTAFLFDLDRELDRQAARGAAISLTRARGGDDAEKATWIPIAELDRSKMFEDHYHIVRKMLALRP